MFPDGCYECNSTVNGDDCGEDTVVNVRPRACTGGCYTTKDEKNDGEGRFSTQLKSLSRFNTSNNK